MPRKRSQQLVLLGKMGRVAPDELSQHPKLPQLPDGEGPEAATRVYTSASSARLPQSERSPAADIADQEDGDDGPPELHQESEDNDDMNTSVEDEDSDDDDDMLNELKHDDGERRGMVIGVAQDFARL